MSGEEPKPENEQPIPGVTFVVPIEAFRSDVVVAAIGATPVVDNNDIHSRLTATSSVAREAGDTSSDALQILAGMASYHFVPDDRVEPFRPMAIMDGRRSLIPSDLLAAQVEVLAELGADIGHPALRARVNDVCRHLDRKDVAAGLRAVDAYVACVEAVFKGEAEFDFEQSNPASVPASEFLRRATIVASSMGWNRPDFDLLRKIIGDVSQRALDNDDAWGFIHIGPINLDKGIWERKAFADAAEKLAGLEAIASDHVAQRELWELAARAHHREKDEANENRCLIAAAETYVGNADARAESAMVQASFLDHAIQALRPIPGTAERRKQLQDLLNEVQPRIRDEMSSFSHEVNITEQVEEVEAYVSGKPLAAVIRILLTCEGSPDPEALRKEVLESSYNSISAIMPMTVSDSQGRTRFKAPGLSLAGPPDEDQVRFLVNQQEQFRRQNAVSVKINTIRRVIMYEHHLSVDILLPIMMASPLVPPDHELIFAKGAIRFFAGDDMEAAHLILPQLENSLRYMLSLSGVETNKINADGTQEEAMLSRLLETHREALLTIFPASILQELDLLFNFRGGPSVRNELAHGKMSDSDFWGSDVAYSVWLVLRMAAIPAFRVWSDVAAEMTRRGAW